MKLYHLFPKLMSLYGDYGNLQILAKYAADRGAEAEVIRWEPLPSHPLLTPSSPRPDSALTPPSPCSDSTLTPPSSRLQTTPIADAIGAENGPVESGPVAGQTGAESGLIEGQSGAESERNEGRIAVENGQNAGEKTLQNEGIPCLSQADFLYMGAGTEAARNAALALLLPHREELKALLAQGVPMLFTGNSITLLGKEITLSDGRTVEGLGLADFTATERPARYTGDALASGVVDGKTTVGFLNKCDEICGAASPLFTLQMGEGNRKGEKAEGVRAGSLWATHLIGPLLVKNPHLLRELGGKLGLDDGEHNGVITGGVYDQMEQAYQVTLQALQNRLGQK